MSLSGGRGVEALWWNRLADWSFSGWDEGQNAWMETVFSVLSLQCAFKATFRGLETFTDN